MYSSAAGVEFRQLIRLAGPLALAQAGTQIMSVVDLAVLGRVGPRELGAAGLGTALFFFAAVIGMGLVMGIDPMISQALGARDELRARHVLWQGIWIALGITAILTIPLLLSPIVLPLFKIQHDVQRMTTVFILVRTAGLAPLLLFLVARAYLQAHHITRPLVVAMLVGNVFNFLSDLLLVFGGASLPWWLAPLRAIPPLGVVGAAISTDLGSFLQLAIVARAVRSIRLPPHDAGALQRPNRWEIARGVHVGLPVGLQMGAEVGIFALVGLLAGRLGALELAAHQLVLSLASLTYTIAVGVSIAASVRVGLAVGARDRRATRIAGFVAIAAGVCWMSVSATIFALAPRQVARIVSNQPDIIAAAVPLLLVAAFFQIADGVQAVAAGALRGAGDTRFSLVANIVGYWVIAFPIGLYLGFARSMGVVGLWWGLCAGLVSVAILLFFRFDRLSSREIVPIGAGRRGDGL
jgi:MATE family multidrug resistance protein